MARRGVRQIGQDYDTGLRPDDARYPTRYNMRWLGVSVAAALLNCLCYQRPFFAYFRMEYPPVGLGSTRKIVCRGYRCSLNRKIPLFWSGDARMETHRDEDYLNIILSMLL